MPQSPHTNPRFRKPQGKIQFRADKDLALILDKLTLDAIPNGDGDPPTKSEVARALIEQAAKQLTGRVAWLSSQEPTQDQLKLAEKAGFNVVLTGLTDKSMFVDFDKLEEMFACVAPIHPWHVIQSTKRGMTMLLFDDKTLYVYHGHGLVRRYQL
jgi:hypothetical protein